MDILGVRVDALNLNDIIRMIGSWIELRTQNYICVTGVHGVVECQDDQDLLQIHRQAGLVVPDGMPLVWAGRHIGLTGMQHVRGADLMLAVLKEAESRGWSSFFYGGAEAVADELVSALRGRLPRLKIAGTHTPPFRQLEAGEQAEVASKINKTEPDLLWVPSVIKTLHTNQR